MAMIITPDVGRSMMEAIAAGRAKYVEQRYKQALASFTEAIKHCPCEVAKRKRKREELEDLENPELPEHTRALLASLTATRARPPPLECLNPLHLQALNYRSGTFEKVPDIRRAQADARRMMDIAPRSPEGYLRAAKLLRAENKSLEAFNVLTEGILACLEGPFEPEHLRILDKARNPLKLKYAKVDPLGSFLSLSWMSTAHLPFELIWNIFGRMDLAALCPCLRVSKSWRRLLAGPASVPYWRSLLFTGASNPRKPVPVRALRRLLSYSSNDIRELLVEDGRRFVLDRRKFDIILKAGTNLEHLEISNPSDALIVTQVPKHLKHLKLDGFQRFFKSHHTGNDPYRAMLLAVAPTLETLDLAGIPRQWFTDAQIPMMPNLKHLRLSKGREQPWALSVVHLLRSTPNLEQLHVEDINLNCILSQDESFDIYCLPNLKALTIVDTKAYVSQTHHQQLAWNHNVAALEAYRHLMVLNAGRNLRVLDLHYGWDYTGRNLEATDIFGHMHGNPAYEYANLEEFRASKLVVSPQVAQDLFEGPIRAGKLHSFDIVFPLPKLQEPLGESSAEHIKKYQWLEGAESIRSIGLYDFYFKSYIYMADHPLINFLNKLPCLEEVRITSNHFDTSDFIVTLRDILNLVKLKSAYIPQISGMAFERIRELAKQKGVDLVWEKRLPKWPLVLKED
ncbi:uncharacterized protein TRIREDRAFT_108530 [Trichoderma reesei QM6a]|uniref:Predicted protein n=2 Tax=Hypocrea jecorina TaxID=51453 RepID=G0RLT4_HYPJQ|nr:uncharacterized protein TRIREDRAFT_108530 [Trichoderma reesei QM6a]EGR47672.1 predicted protein [Trichoderma reesei QM6a]